MSAYYEDPDITVWHGPCEPLLAEMGDDSVDIVVTSPPYNMGLTPGGNGRGMYRHPNQKAGRFDAGYDGTGDDAMNPDAYDEWQRSVLAECWRVARLAVWWNHRPRVIHGRMVDPLGGDYGPAVLRQRIIWNRLTGIDVGLRQFCTRGEYILLFAKPEFRLASHAVSGWGDVWDLGIAHGVDHPAPFPDELPQRCIAASAGAMSVLDPFCGSGTTIRAARDAGTRAIGIDKVERFCRMTAARLGSWEHSVTPDCLFAPAGVQSSPAQNERRADERSSQ